MDDKGFLSVQCVFLTSTFDLLYYRHKVAGIFSLYTQTYTWCYLNITFLYSYPNPPFGIFIEVFTKHYFLFNLLINKHIQFSSMQETGNNLKNKKYTQLPLYYQSSTELDW